MATVFVFGGLLVQPATASSSIPCDEAETLAALIACVLEGMPRADTEGFVIPDPALSTAWHAVVAAMRSGACNAADLPAVLADAGYILTDFVSDTAAYCVLYEGSDTNLDGSVDRGWGTLIVNLQPRRLVDIQIAHPLNDSNTGTQGISLFERTGARAFLMAGTHRRANAATSTCQSSFKIADAAHNTNLPFHWIAAAMQAEDSTRNVVATSLQFHGMASSSCVGVDVYLTQGSGTLALDTAGALMGLQTALVDKWSTWQVTIPGDAPTCNLSGGSNVQGRLKNGVPAEQVCTQAAVVSDISGTFIHIEQKIAFRDPLDWVGALEEVFPEVQQVAIEQPGEVAEAMSQEVFGSVYPNPFGSQTTIFVETHRSQTIVLTLYDLLGRQRRVVHEGWLRAGEPLRIPFYQTDLPAGFYVLHIVGERQHHLLPLLAR